MARLADDAEAMLDSGGPVVLQVSPRHAFSATGGWIEVSSGALAWSGSILDVGGAVGLILEGAGVTGTLQLAALQGRYGQYGISPLGGRLHVLACVDASKFPPD